MPYPQRQTHIRRSCENAEHLSGGESDFFPGNERRREYACNPIWLADISREWESVLHLGRPMSFKAKEYIPPGHGGDNGFYYLKHGKVRVAYSGRQSREITLYHLGEGAMIYELATHNYMTWYHAYSITPVDVYFFSLSGFLTEEFAAAHPKLMINIIHAQALKNMHYMRRVINIAGGNAFSNTCRLMLALSRCHGDAREIPLGVTHEEIASLLCVRRSWLGKILRRLKDEGIISRCTKSRLVITDLDKLTSYAAQ